jgi:hypothetical protein
MVAWVATEGLNQGGKMTVADSKKSPFLSLPGGGGFAMLFPQLFTIIYEPDARN